MNYNSPIVKSGITELNNIYIKREDLLPFSFGGNKARIAYEFYQDMINKGCNCMVGYGSAQSNLCRVLANICATNNMPCYIITPSEKKEISNNMLLTKMCKAKYRFCKKNAVSETVTNVMNEIMEIGLKPYYIYGNSYGKGNEAVPVNAYIKAYKEIRKQNIEKGLRFDYIFLATGTGMTQSGLIVGKKFLGGNERIIGISIARKREICLQNISKYVDAYGEDIDLDDSDVLEQYILGGYGNGSEEIKQVIQSVLQKDGIALDITYTGKAFWGMLEYLKEQDIVGKNILFIHTGGIPLFFNDLWDISQ